MTVPSPSVEQLARALSAVGHLIAGIRTVRLFDGDRWIDAILDNFLYVPAGGLHAFHNDSDEPASLLLLFAPVRRVRNISRDSQILLA